jgi:hypothetical protein
MSVTINNPLVAVFLYEITSLVVNVIVVVSAVGSINARLAVFALCLNTGVLAVDVPVATYDGNNSILTVLNDYFLARVGAATSNKNGTDKEAHHQNCEQFNNVLVHCKFLLFLFTFCFSCENTYLPFAEARDEGNSWAKTSNAPDFRTHAQINVLSR